MNVPPFSVPFCILRDVGSGGSGPLAALGQIFLLGLQLHGVGADVYVPLKCALPLLKSWSDFSLACRLLHRYCWCPMCCADLLSEDKQLSATSFWTLTVAHSPSVFSPPVSLILNALLPSGNSRAWLSVTAIELPR